MVIEGNPVLARRFRGGSLESLHRGCWVVVDTDGRRVAGAGDPDQAIFPRSSSKSLQALAVFDAGAVDRFRLDSEQRAVMVSSHNGEPVHERIVSSLLAAAGLDETALRCGHATPFDEPRAAKRRIAHNCSGKHAGFLAGTVALGQAPSTYLDPDGQFQRQVQTAVTTVAGLADGQWRLAIDGCSAPTFEMPLRSLALGIARVANPASLPSNAARYRPHCASILDSVAEHPHLVAGTTPPRFDTAVLRATSGRLFAKGGADGVQVVGVRGAGIAFAGKCDDGSARALQPLALQVLADLGHLAEDEAAQLVAYTDPAIRNADNIVVGEQRLAPTGT